MNDSDTEWAYGIHYNYLRDVVAFWQTEYDWRAEEAAIAALPHFTMTLVRLSGR